MENLMEWKFIEDDKIYRNHFYLMRSWKDSQVLGKDNMYHGLTYTKVFACQAYWRPDCLLNRLLLLYSR